MYDYVIVGAGPPGCRARVGRPARGREAPRMSAYVLVGPGSAGCVPAPPLSEAPAVNVLLVEAGPPDTSDLVHIPAAFSALFRTERDWDHMTAWEPGCNGRRIYLPRGRMLGGSSSINAMIYIRGNRADYDEWAAQGCAGWAYDDLLPYFKRAEDNERGANEWHGAGGPLPVADGRARTQTCADFLEAADASGLPANPDFNAARAGRRRLVPGHAARRQTGERRGRLPAPGDVAPEPRGQDRLPRPPGAVRRHARGRHPGGGRRARRAARRARGRRLGRRVQLATDPHALGARSPGGARRASDPRRRRGARGGPEPVRPPDRRRRVRERGGLFAEGRAMTPTPTSRPTSARPRRRSTTRSARAGW